MGNAFAMGNNGGGLGAAMGGGNVDVNDMSDAVP